MVDGKTVGIAVSSYILDSKTNTIMMRSINSLLKASAGLDAIYIVDDGSTLPVACSYYRGLKDRVKVEYQCVNRGISITKNHSLCLLKDFDIIILADNDVVYRSNWAVESVSKMVKAQINSMALSGIIGSKPSHSKDHNGIPVRYYANHHGCLMFVTKEALQRVGGFAILPAKYGQEHTHWQHRLAKEYDHVGFVLDVGISPHVSYRHIPNTFTTASDKKRMIEENGLALEKLEKVQFFPYEYEPLDE